MFAINTNIHIYWGFFKEIHTIGIKKPYIKIMHFLFKMKFEKYTPKKINFFEKE